MSPPPSQPQAVLLEFDRWANERLFDACEGLTDEQLDRAFEMGLGTLRKTITHMLGAMRGWTDVLLEAEAYRPRPEEDPPRSIAELRALHDEVASEFAKQATAGDTVDLVHPERRGTRYTFSRGGILTHVTTHSMHHRAQCLNMLRHIGADPLPESSVMQWMVANPPV